MKVTSLYINNVNNVEVRYKYIKNTDMNDIVEYKEQSGTIRDILLDIKKNNGICQILESLCSARFG